MRKTSSYSRFAVLPMLLVALGATACVIDDNGDVAPGINSPGEAVSVPIDIGQRLVLNQPPGHGVVAVIATAVSEGQWKIEVVCDTVISGAICAFDVFVSSADGSAVPSDVQGENLLAGDFIEPSGNSWHLQTNTDFEAQAIDFSLPKGDAMQLEVYLDGVGQGQYVQWIGGGMQHLSAPSDPVNFDPVEVSNTTSSTMSSGTTHPAGSGGGSPAGTGGGGTGGSPGAGGAGGGTGGGAGGGGTRGGGGGGSPGTGGAPGTGGSSAGGAAPGTGGSAPGAGGAGGG